MAYYKRGAEEPSMFVHNIADKNRDANWPGAYLFSRIGVVCDAAKLFHKWCTDFFIFTSSTTKQTYHALHTN